MEHKLTTFEKLSKTFSRMGVTLPEPDGGGFVQFEYESCPYVMGIDEEEELFYFTELVVGPEGHLPKHIFESALDITGDFHKGIYGEWTENYAFIASRIYTTKGRRYIYTTFLKRILEEFSEAHGFIEMNVFLMMDESIWKNLET